MDGSVLVILKVWLLGAHSSLLIEMSQFLNNRRMDIDDLILNTLGAVPGLWSVYWAFSAFS